MKYLGIDFGSKRIGLSVSDEAGKMAFPYSVILNNEKLLTEIKKIIESEKIEGIVMGESKNFEGEPNVIMKEVDKFKKLLEEKTKLPVLFEPEFMTSQQAQREIRSRRPDTRSDRESRSRLKSRGKNEMHDASAAAIILQSFLDKKDNMIQ